MDELWAKVAGSGIVIFISTLFGVKMAQARTQAKLDGLHDSLSELKASMGREIRELKTEVHKIRDDFYKPKV
jgi:hypothetical protein